MNQIVSIGVDDIFTRENYKKQRKVLRERMVLRKKNRRLDVGPHVTMYFENKDTIIHQINEMVYIENGGKQQIKEEIEAYKSLLPNGNELVATVMIEIDNPIKRAEFLGKMGGFEETFAISINGKQVFGKAELDMDRTTAEGKASSVQFVHFNFDREIANDFKSNDYEIIISVNHDTYKHSTTLNKETSLELSKDFF